jgi:hypothetical protein
MNGTYKKELKMNLAAYVDITLQARRRRDTDRPRQRWSQNLDRVKGPKLCT